ncbi:interferon alpha-inducible protein 27-like protein 2A [Xyrichtys novacula]|uniref:Interferon alpha-inducible protein 27-like protein 2A n=1 Tax=Xyrichtys novacula TaxID=13765 RepID=A0AAV1GN59_XYRNO|nr:interferon alpha-inducible protein 27-like protein 2A [Xyrichtys novacula]
MGLGTFVVIGAGAVGTVALVPVALGAAGFTSAGIAAGSLGAKLMSAAAVANGGGVAAGSVVATLQSAGAAGLSGAATTAVGWQQGVSWLLCSQQVQQACLLLLMQLWPALEELWEEGRLKKEYEKCTVCSIANPRESITCDPHSAEEDKLGSHHIQHSTV